MQEVLMSLTAVCVHTREEMVLEIPMAMEDEQHIVKSRFQVSFQGQSRQFLTPKSLFILPPLWAMTEAAQILPFYLGSSSTNSSSFALRTLVTCQARGKATPAAASSTAEAVLQAVDQEL